MDILACSGPGAGAAIADSIAIGFTHAEIAGALVGISLILRMIVSRGFWLPFACVLLLALHPAWTISAISGDCGYLKRDASYAVTAIMGVLVAIQAWSALVARRRSASSDEHK